MDQYHLCKLILLYVVAHLTLVSSSWITLSGPDIFNSTGRLPMSQSTAYLIPLDSEDLNFGIESTTWDFSWQPHNSSFRSHRKKEHNNDALPITTTNVLDITTIQSLPQIPPSDNIEDLKHTFTIWVNKSSFSSFITWKLREDNTTKLEVNLLPQMEDYLPETGVLVQFELPSENGTYFDLCETPEITCGPVIEVTTSVQDIIGKKPILEIKINRTKFMLYSNLNHWSCVYWNNNEQMWKTDGLETVIDDQFITCFSTHLTLFSVLFDSRNIIDPRTLVQDLPEYHDFVLSTISNIGSLLSIPSILLTIASYPKKTWSESETTKILIQCCTALLFVHSSYHVYHWLGQIISCSVVNFITHYSVAAFLLWTACDGVNMWRMLFNDVFNTRGDVFYRGCKIICWGLPLFATTIGVIVTDFGYERCQLRFNRICEFMLFIVPYVLILCCNLLLFIQMLTKVICKNTLSHLRNRKVEYIMALAQVFNISWCIAFPLLWCDATRLLGQYLFASIVSSQGIFLFFIRCAKDGELKKRISNFVQIFSSFSNFNTSISHSVSHSPRSRNYSHSQVNTNHTRWTDSK